MWQLIVVVVSNSLEQEPVARAQSYRQRIVSMRVLYKATAKLSMEDLDHAADHFTDLVEQEGLPLQIESDELEGPWITLFCQC